MKNGLLLILCIVSGILSWNESQAQSVIAERPQTIEQAVAQREKAAIMRGAAEKQYAEGQQECHRKVFVNNCLAKVKKRYREAMLAARDMDNQARDFDHQVRRDDAQEKIAERIKNQEHKAETHKLQAEQHRQDEAARQVKREKKLAEKSQQAEEGRRKRAEERARHQAKQERREKRNAEKATK